MNISIISVLNSPLFNLLNKVGVRISEVDALQCAGGTGPLDNLSILLYMYSRIVKLRQKLVHAGLGQKAKIGASWRGNVCLGLELCIALV